MMLKTIPSEFDQQRGVLTLHMPERFDFELHRAFRNTYRQAQPLPRAYVIDLSSVTAMDSSALGMLLLLREHAGGESADIHVVNACNEVRELLDAVGFDRLFMLQ